MAGKQIELEFSVADGGSKILEDLKHVKSIADGNDAYTGLNYRLSPQSRNALENDLKTIQKSVEKANTASGSSVNMSALQKEVAARRQITIETEKTIAAAKQMQQATEATAKATQDSAKAKKNDTAESTRMMNIEMQMGNYAKKYGDNISKNITLQAKFNDLMGKVQRGDIGAQEAAKEWAAYRLECRKAGVEVETLGQKLNKLFGESFKQRAKFLISTSALAAARQAVRDVKEIDSAMTELRKVTDETADTYNKFMVNAGSRAKDIGATMSDVIKSTADFARLGYDIKDASKLADAAIVLKNVGDGITDIDDASEKIISVVKAFPEFEGNAMSVVDKMNEVGKQYCPAA